MEDWFGMEWPEITLADVREAERRIRPHLRATPLYRYAGLDRLVDAAVWVKHENHQPVGAFKVRGGVNLVSQLGEDERRRGLIAASTGNHGQSVAYAARLFGVAARICVPEGANPVKLDAMASLGADLIVHGGRTSTRPASTASGSSPSTATATSTPATSRS